VSFGQAVAARPLDVDKLKEVSERVRLELGEGALVEAASAAAGMEISTRIVDMAGKPPFSPAMLNVVRSVMATMRIVGVTFSKLLSCFKKP